MPTFQSALLILTLVAGFCCTPADLFGAQPEVITNSIEMKLVLIPAGHFMMGTEEGRSDTLHAYPYCDPKWLDGELPHHKVRITKPFYMGQYEVTLGQFLMFYNEAKYKLEIERDGKPSWGYDRDGKTLIESTAFRPWAPGWEIGLDHPVVYVSWNDAVAFCEWLSKREHKKYRLPTEAEWEYACRAAQRPGIFSATIRKTWFAMPMSRTRTANRCGRTNTRQFRSSTRLETPEPPGRPIPLCRATTATLGRRRSADFSPTPSASSTCTAMSGSGAPTGTTICITKTRRSTIRRGRNLAWHVLPAAAVSTTRRFICAAPSATMTNPPIATVTTAFA